MAENETTSRVRPGGLPFISVDSQFCEGVNMNPAMKQQEVKLCVVCWEDSIATQAFHYPRTIPVCDKHCACVCGRCERRWATRLGRDGRAVFSVCDECNETLERLEARREAYKTHLSSDEWRKARKTLKTESRREHGRVVCSRCGMTEHDNKVTYGEGLHGHHKTYERFGQEKPEDVELLCSRCHAWVHGNPAPKPIRDFYAENLRKAMH